MGKSSQRKGRRGEREAAAEADEFDLDTRVHGPYEQNDITIEGDVYEVKTCEKISMRTISDFILNDVVRGVIHKFKRQRRTMTVDYRDWLEDQRELKELRGRVPQRVVLTQEGRSVLGVAEAEDLDLLFNEDTA